MLQIAECLHMFVEKSFVLLLRLADGLDIRPPVAQLELRTGIHTEIL
jgi:hypothetical protein